MTPRRRIPRPACGTPIAYRYHQAVGETPCYRCREAHARQLAKETAAQRADHPARYWAALGGDEPAEALTTADRARLVGLLHAWGWTDVQVAAHTRMTTFTSAEIRTRLGLPPNPGNSVPVPAARGAA